MYSFGSQTSAAMPSPELSAAQIAGPTCSNCGTQTTPLWRRSEDGMSVLCNACSLYQKLKGTPRPIALKTDVIKHRNRSKGEGGRRDRAAKAAAAAAAAAEADGQPGAGPSTARRGTSTSRTRAEAGMDSQADPSDAKRARHAPSPPADYAAPRSASVDTYQYSQLGPHRTQPAHPYYAYPYAVPAPVFAYAAPPMPSWQQPYAHTPVHSNQLAPMRSASQTPSPHGSQGNSPRSQSVDAARPGHDPDGRGRARERVTLPPLHHVAPPFPDGLDRANTLAPMLGAFAPPVMPAPTRRQLTSDVRSSSESVEPSRPLSPASSASERETMSPPPVPTEVASPPFSARGRSVTRKATNVTGRIDELDEDGRTVSSHTSSTRDTSGSVASSARTTSTSYTSLSADSAAADELAKLRSRVYELELVNELLQSRIGELEKRPSPDPMAE